VISASTVQPAGFSCRRVLFQKGPESGGLHPLAFISGVHTQTLEISIPSSWSEREALPTRTLPKTPIFGSVAEP
jgi:hypothetical protein